MSDQTIIDKAINSYQRGNCINALQAKVIASEWHDGQASELYKLASTGAISEGIEGEIRANRRSAQIRADIDAVAELEALLDYVQSRGERGPQNGWDSLSW